MENIEFASIENRLFAASQGRDEDLDVLVHDKDWRVREVVAQHGRDKDLKILVHDENKYVRETVAEQGRDEDLEILSKDVDEEIRSLVQKEKAINKMNAEMQQEHSDAEDKLHNWLCSHIEGDGDLAEGILAKGHTISGAMQYCSDKARKSVAKGARFACVEDDVVYSWAREYFLSKQAMPAKPKIVQKPQEKQDDINLFDLAEACEGSGASKDKSSIDNNDAHKSEKSEEKTAQAHEEESDGEKKAPGRKSEEKYETISLFDF